MITDPAIVKFSNEQMRRAADALETAALVIETLEARYRDWGIETKYDAMTDEEKASVVDDGASQDGRPVYLAAYIDNYVNNARGLIAQFNADLGNGTTMRQQLRYMATNPRNPLLND